MSRLFQPARRGCGWLAFATLAVSGLLASSAGAAEMSFWAYPIYNGVPNAGADVLVFYNLPTTGPYAGPVNTSFDLRARIDPLDGTTETASAFGLIARLSGTGQVVFNPPAIDEQENNLEPAKNPLVEKNNSFDILYANTGVQTGNNREIDVIGIEVEALQNNLVTNGDGLTSIPIQIAAGATGTYTVAFDLPATYTGFVKTISETETEFLTNSGAFPHAGATIEVRRSRKADMNGDGNINSADIGGFIGALNSLSSFSTQFPWLQSAYISDVNEDGNTNSADIGGFIAQLNNPSPSPQAVPEPSTISMLGIAALFGAGIIRRRRRLSTHA